MAHNFFFFFPQAAPSPSTSGGCAGAAAPTPAFPPVFPCDPIDEADRGDALACVDYVGDIMDALFESEVREEAGRGAARGDGVLRMQPGDTEERALTRLLHTYRNAAAPRPPTSRPSRPRSTRRCGASWWTGSWR